jgi:hypothetical protein
MRADFDLPRRVLVQAWTIDESLPAFTLVLTFIVSLRSRFDGCRAPEILAQSLWTLQYCPQH